MAAKEDSGRTNQKRRTRMAIVEACRQVIRSGGLLTMPEVARSALVSEATAYRYFPDLASLVNEALVGLWPSPTEALSALSVYTDPVERVAFACEFLLRHVLAYQGAIRSTISATLLRPEMSATRPGFRFGLIDQALAPLNDTLGTNDPQGFDQLKQDLAAVISAEALFTLMDLCALPPDEAIESLVRSTRAVTEVALRTIRDSYCSP